MFDAPVDAWYVWIGLALVSAALVVVAAEFPAGPPPDAAGAADTVDAVAAGPYPATAEHPVVADAARIGPRRIALRGEGTTHATFEFGPVVPTGDGPLGRVLDGLPPDRVFDSPGDLAAAANESRARDPEWRPAGGEIAVRKVVWGDLNVTLVGA